MKEQRLLTIGMDAHSISAREARLIFEDAVPPPKTEAERKAESEKEVDDFSIALKNALEDREPEKNQLKKSIEEKVLKDGKATEEEMKKFLAEVKGTVASFSDEPLPAIREFMDPMNALMQIALSSKILTPQEFSIAEEKGLNQAKDEEESKRAEETEQEDVENGIPPEQKAQEAFKNWTKNATKPEEIEANQTIIDHMIDLQQQIDTTQKEYSEAQLRSRPEADSTDRNNREYFKGRKEEIKAHLRSLREEFRAYERVFQSKNPNPNNPKYGKSLHTYRMETDAKYRDDFTQKDNILLAKIQREERQEDQVKAEKLAGDKLFKRYQSNRGMVDMQLRRDARINGALAANDVEMAQGGVSSRFTSPAQAGKIADLERRGGVVKRGARYTVGPMAQPTLDSDRYETNPLQMELNRQAAQTRNELKQEYWNKAVGKPRQGSNDFEGMIASNDTGEVFRDRARSRKEKEDDQRFQERYGIKNFKLLYEALAPLENTAEFKKLQKEGNEVIRALELKIQMLKEAAKPDFTLMQSILQNDIPRVREVVNAEKANKKLRDNVGEPETIEDDLSLPASRTYEIALSANAEVKISSGKDVVTLHPKRMGGLSNDNRERKALEKFGISYDVVEELDRKSGSFTLYFTKSGLFTIDVGAKLKPEDNIHEVVDLRTFDDQLKGIEQGEASTIGLVRSWNGERAEKVWQAMENDPLPVELDWTKIQPGEQQNVLDAFSSADNLILKNVRLDQEYRFPSATNLSVSFVRQPKQEYLQGLFGVQSQKVQIDGLKKLSSAAFPAESGSISTLLLSDLTALEVGSGETLAKLNLKRLSCPSLKECALADIKALLRNPQTELFLGIDNPSDELIRYLKSDVNLQKRVHLSVKGETKVWVGERTQTSPRLEYYDRPVVRLNTIQASRYPGVWRSPSSEPVVCGQEGSAVEINGRTYPVFRKLPEAAVSGLSITRGYLTRLTNPVTGMPQDVFVVDNNDQGMRQLGGRSPENIEDRMRRGLVGPDRVPGSPNYQESPYRGVERFEQWIQQNYRTPPLQTIDASQHRLQTQQKFSPNSVNWIPPLFWPIRVNASMYWNGKETVAVGNEEIPVFRREQGATGREGPIRGYVHQLYPPAMPGQEWRNAQKVFVVSDNNPQNAGLDSPPEPTNDSPETPVPPNVPKPASEYEEAAVDQKKEKPKNEAEKKATELEKAKILVFNANASELREATDRIEGTDPAPGSSEGKDAKEAILSEIDHLKSYQEIFKGTKEGTVHEDRLKALVESLKKYRSPIDDASEELDLMVQKLNAAREKNYLDQAKDLKTDTEERIKKAAEGSVTPEEVLEALGEEKTFLEDRYEKTFDRGNTTHLESHKKRLEVLGELMKEWEKKVK